MAIKKSNKMSETLKDVPYTSESLNRVDTILDLVDPEFRPYVEKIREKIEFAVLNNPESENDIIKSLVGYKSKFNKIMLSTEFKKQSVIKDLAA